MWKKRPGSSPQLVNSSRTTLCGTYHPMNRHVRKPTTGRNICPVMKSKQSNSDLPNNDSPSAAPNDREQKAPMMAVLTVTMAAAFLRLMCISSWKKAVDTSCSDMSDVSAANDSSTKNSSEMT